MKKLIYENTTRDMTDEEILEGLEPEELEDLTELEKQRLADSYRETWNEDEFLNIKYFLINLHKRINAQKYMIKGTLGLWDGPHTGKILKDNLEEALYFIIGRDCEVQKITEEDGILNIEVSHHDGRNYFSIRPLNQKGYEYYDKYEYDSSMTDRELYNQLDKEEFLGKIEVKKEEMI